MASSHPRVTVLSLVIAVGGVGSGGAARPAHADFGGFATPIVFPFAECEFCGPFVRAVADFDGDGDRDVLATLASPATGTEAFVMRNNGDGSLIRLPSFGNVGILGVASGDIDGDEDEDVVTTNSLSNTFQVFKNNGSGIFAAWQLDGFPSGETSPDLELVDLDHDGDLDVVAGVQSPGKVYLSLNDGAGSFAPWLSLQLPGSPAEVAVGDLDGDGWSDLLFTDAVLDGIWVLRAAGPVSFDAPVLFTMQTPGSPATLNHPARPTLVDADQDGDPDLACLRFQEFYFGQQVVVLTNDGDGQLSAPTPVYSHFDALGDSSMAAFALGDLDGDHDLDLATVTAGGMVPPTSLRMLFGDGAGGFAFGAVLASGRDGINVAFDDLDGNGSTDIVFASRKFLGFGFPGAFGGELSTYINLTTVVPPSEFALIGVEDGLQSVPLPHVPTGPGQVAVNVELAWSKSFGTDVVYHLLIAREGVRDEIVLATTLVTTKFAIPEGVLQAGKTYRWGVTALQGFGATSSTPASYTFATQATDPGGCEGDLTRDGVVDGADLGLLLAQWGWCE